MCLTYLVICCFVGVALAKTEAEVKLWFMEQGATCINDYPVTGEELQLMHKHTVPDTRNSKCFIACVFKKAEWMDDSGMFSEANAVKTAEIDHSDDPTKIENAKKLFAMCKSVNEETYNGADAECERAAALAKCFISNAPKMGFKMQ